MRALVFPALLWLMGCPYLGEEVYGDRVRDADGDGVMGERFGGLDCLDNDPKIKRCDEDGDGENSIAAGGQDCNDNDPFVYPGAEERCNEVDDDCDGLTDDEDDDLVNPPMWFLDDDGDNYGNPAEGVGACEAPANHVSDDRDCNDARDDIHPGATEFCDDLDRNCDGDFYADAVDPIDWYVDADGDGFGVGVSVQLACEGVTGLAATNDDCDDTAASAYPGAQEIWYDGIDQDCLGGSDWDADGDGHDQMPNGPDCDDTDASISPDALEVCDGGLDNNCNGVADSEDATTDPLGQVVHYLDADQDGFGDDETATGFCPGTEPDGWILLSGDCNDAIDSVLPGGVELCDSLDNDCDGEVDEAAVGVVDYFVDADGDGYGGPDIQPACSEEPGLALIGGDCDDADPFSYPGAPEICGDAVRQDCTALSVDDCDSDGHADIAAGGDDCDDARADVHPGANEVCDGVDNNCTGLIDDDDPAVDLSTVDDWYTDSDGDGYGSTTLYLADACAPIPGAAVNFSDCDDTNPDTYPGAIELCDGVDNTCDGIVDEQPVADPPTYYIDADGDGFGNPALSSTLDCDPPGANWVLDSSDCQDGFDAVNPLAVEICDGLDNNCDGLIDDADPTAVVTEWFLDADGDGYGDDGVTLTQCDQPAGYAPIGSDCDDGNANMNPGAAEICDGGVDNDCDGLGDDADPDLDTVVTWYPDADGDGYGDGATSVVQCTQPPGWVNNANDCDDLEATVSPAAIELCDSVDNDCDLLVDDADPGVVGAPFWFDDRDGDAWGDENSYVKACDPPPGMLPQSGDCDDADASIHPGADEVCDSIDNDCDGYLDDLDPSVDATVWYADLDADGFGDPDSSVVQCAIPQGAWTTDGTDCDDGDASVRPLAVEVCNFVDDDCDGEVDDDDPDVTGLGTWYFDADNDYWGDDNQVFVGCEAPPGYVVNGGDCDDTNAFVSPGALVEFCNGIDDDCDGLTDGDDPGAVGDSYYVDADGDGFGDVDIPVQQGCFPGPGYSYDGGDCDDTDTAIHPFAFEDCDGIDNDCNGLVDAADPNVANAMWLYPDADGDGFGNDVLGAPSCSAIPGWVFGGGDCDDFDALVFPGAVEYCDGFDRNCDGLIGVDDPTAVDQQIWYDDQDGDGYGRDPSGVFSCDDPHGGTGVLMSQDCDDVDPQVYPGAVEVCDGFDNNCDLMVDDNDPAVVATVWYVDLDGDGFGYDESPACVPAPWQVPDGGDCDDSNSAVNPGAVELCDFVDNDCDLLMDDDDDDVAGQLIWYRDGDGDGDGDLNWPIEACQLPPNYTFSSGDCDDTNPSVNSVFAQEVCNGIDDDCDLLIDDDDGSLVSAYTWYEDLDGDGHGSGVTQQACDPGPGWVESGATDCDDTAPDVYQGAFEVCDGVDNNCDGQIDETGALGSIPWYSDGDGDGYGAGGGFVACSDPGGMSDRDGDCNDGNPAIHPGAIEICDGFDNDCDGNTDDQDAQVVGPSWYFDGDGDGFGDDASVTQACGEPAGYTLEGADCDDGDAALYPGQSVIVSPASAYTTIQGAVAAVCDDATIRVASGTYAEQLDLLGKKVTILGIDPSQPPVLDAPVNPAIRAVSGEPAGTTIESFVVRVQSAVAGAPGGAEVDLGADVTFREVRFEDITTSSQAGIYVGAASATVESCDFVRLAPTALTAASGAEVLVVGSHFDQNTTVDSGGAVSVSDASVAILDSVFTNNSAALFGGALRATGASSVSVYDSQFSNNTGSGGTVSLDCALFSACDLTMDGIVVDGGGGIKVTGTSALNTVELRDGYLAGLSDGAECVGVFDAATLDVTNVAVVNCTGNGLYTAATTANLFNNTLVGNTNHGIAVDGSAGQVVNNLFYGNTGPNEFSATNFTGTAAYNAFTNAAEASNWGNSVSGVPPFLLYHAALDPGLWNLHTEPFGLAFDSGDPSITDDDGSTSDIGVHGGPGGDQGSYFFTVDDGLSDGWELDFFGAIDLFGDLDDPDGDGLDNLTERTTTYTSPVDADTDMDGTNDALDLEPTNPGVQ